LRFTLEPSKSEAIFCPFCHHKNANDAEICVYCGALLAVEAPLSRTTEKVSPSPVIIGKVNTLIRHYLPKLPENTFGLFVMDNEEPLIIENSAAIHIGRLVQDETIPWIDLTEYGAVELGVSRAHARITCSEGRYRLEDLGSTNGTWINGERLAYGKPYELHNSDSILLGQLQLTICLMESQALGGVRFEAQRIKTLDTVRLQILTPHFMETTLSKFLQAIIDIYSICLLCCKQTPKDVYVLSIKAMEQTPAVEIILDDGEEALRQVRKWLIPLRHSFLGATSLKALAEDNAFLKELHCTAENILLDVNPALEDALKKELLEKLKPPLVALVISELEIRPSS
jgi:hypothetical protein